MPIKTIVVPFQGREEELGAVMTAFSIAKTFKAHVEVWHVSPDSYDVMTPFMTYALVPVYPQATIDELKAANAKRRAQVAKIYSDAVRKAGITTTDIRDVSASLHHAQGRIEDIIGQRSRLADLVVVSRAIRDDDNSPTSILHQLIFHSGHPLILVPASTEAFEISDNAVIAWDGSAEAARAVSDALPFLKTDQTFILSVLTDIGKDIPLPQKELAEFLNRHQIQTKLIEYDAKKSDLPESLLASAKAHSASLLVMGAYSHTRLQEIIFGGATKYMLEHADIPVLLSH